MTKNNDISLIVENSIEELLWVEYVTIYAGHFRKVVKFWATRFLAFF